MKKIVKGRKYDTETAQAICSKNCYSMKRKGICSLFEVFREFKPVICAVETVYQKKNGEYFLYHEPTGDDECDWEETIEPLTDERALELCQEFMSGDEYEERFGKVEE